MCGPKLQVPRGMLPARSVVLEGLALMRKFCRECNTVMAGQARFCPACGRRWWRTTRRHLAEIAELVAPLPACPMYQATLSSPAMFCRRCGLVLHGPTRD